MIKENVQTGHREENHLENIKMSVKEYIGI
jgi:hypothetical protein